MFSLIMWGTESYLFYLSENSKDALKQSFIAGVNDLLIERGRTALMEREKKKGWILTEYN